MIHDRLPSVEQIVLESCVEHGVTVTEFFGNGRHRRLFTARWQACRRLRDERRMSGPEIASAVGYRSHTSVWLALRKTAAEAGR